MKHPYLKLPLLGLYLILCMFLFSACEELFLREVDLDQLKNKDRIYSLIEKFMNECSKDDEYEIEVRYEDTFMKQRKVILWIDIEDVHYRIKDERFNSKMLEFLNAIYNELEDKNTFDQYCLSLDELDNDRSRFPMYSCFCSKKRRVANFKKK